MNILMIAPQPFFSPRGTPLSVYYRMSELSKLGHSVDLLTYPIGQDVSIPRTKIIRGPGFPFIHHVKVGPSIIKLVLDMLLFFKAVLLLFKSKYDVIFAHEEAVFFAVIFRKLFKVQFIYDMHSSLPQQLSNFNSITFRPVVKVFSILEKLSLMKASAIITICQELEDQVAGSGYSDKHELIQNTLFYPIHYLDDIQRVELEDIFITDGKKIVLYAGTFEPYQGLDMYLDCINIIARERKDVLFMIIGGSAKQVLDLRGKVDKMGISDNIIITGTLEVNIVKDFIKKADVLVSPRLMGTNTPLKIYEFMASGVPIVATNLRTHTQELDQDCAYLQRPDPDDFAEGILACINDQEEAKRRARNAFSKYNEKFGESVMRKNLQEL